MNNRIDARLAALVAEVDTLGRSALLYELNHGDPLEGTMGLDLSMESLEKMIASFTD